ncbi:MAG: hypothetical protein LBV28_00505 [Puniceicoccales bacterium]|jgi:Spy/CpxP family protein refolding chaperone|nr:hypothetical protein [Puniceicoccales bacterium]
MKKFIQFLPITCAALALAAAPLAAYAADDEAAPPPPRRQRGEGFGSGGARGGPQAGARLTPEERTKLNAAIKKVSTNADIVAARKASQDAQKKLLDLTKAAVIKADPELEAVVKKAGDRALLAPPGGNRGPGQPGAEGGRRRGPAPKAPESK